MQHSLSAMRPELKEAGYHYPKSGNRREDYHHVLTGLYGNFDVFRPQLRTKFRTAEKARAAANRFLQEAAEKAHNEKAHTLILSSELLYPTKGKPISMVGEALKALFDEITPVLYVREAASHYSSRLQQNAKQGKFLKPFRQGSLRSKIEQIEECFDNRPIIHGFSKSNLKGGDVSKDFFSRVLNLDVEPKTFRSNESLSAEAVCALIATAEAIRSEGYYPQKHRLWGLIRKLRAYEDRDGQLTKHSLHPALQKKIRETAVDYVWLRDRYGIEFDELDYPNITPLQEGEELKFEQLGQVIDVSIEKSVALILKLSGKL